MREVTTEGMEFPATVEAYSVPEAAAALGRTPLTLKRWIEDDLIPEPVLQETTRGYRQYSVGELTVIARVLAAHEAEFSYYAHNHERTRVRMEQEVFGYREHNI